MPQPPLEPMREPDLKQVTEIEASSFPGPWPAGAFREELKNPWARCLVVRENGQVAGYICYWILGDELLVNNLAVRPEVRRRGFGAQLLDHALKEALEAGCRMAYLEVRASNAVAIRLYESRGFAVIRRRPAYYAETREDALVMRAALHGLRGG